MSDSRSNIVLIGMPGAGKSSVGRLLAQRASMHFIDTDKLIRTAAQGRSLQDIVDREGYLALRRLEEKVLLELHCSNHVIATGGSAVYSQVAMAHLRKQGVIVLLEVDLPTLRARIHDFDTRGLVKRPEQTLEDLFAERSALYLQYADLSIDCRRRSPEDVSAAILAELGTADFRGQA
ncbi:MAG: shikimate kinase [Proteobacteria bacterium]|nr:shikimate kinase [Pseudomonadota bacterium]